MANPQKENGHPDIYKDGHIDIAHPLAKKWRSYRLSGEEWQILWVIMGKTWGWHKAWDNISIKRFYTETGIKKPNIIRAINKLIIKKIVIKSDNKDNKKLSRYHINSHFEQWSNVIKKDNDKNVINKDNKTLSIKITGVINNDNEKTSNLLPDKDLLMPKETLTKENTQKKGNVVLVETVDKSIELKKEMLDLVSGCFKEDFLNKLFKQYPVEKIEKYFEELKYKEGVNNPVGWLVAALKNDYQEIKEEGG